LKSLEKEGRVRLPYLPDFATNNAHMYYFSCDSLESRTGLIGHLKKNDILAVFHYLSLHESAFYRDKHDGRPLPCSDRYTERLVRLPLYFELTEKEQDKIIDAIVGFFAK
jgi:dTDP-4-amino-4,6-dideoxygalactose transaminase